MSAGQAACYSGWDVWLTRAYRAPDTWSARPAGALVAVITGARTEGELAASIRKYERRLGDHLDAAVVKLAGLEARPEGWAADQAAVTRALVTALSNLSRLLDRAPARAW